MARLTENDCMFEAERMAAANGWTHFQMMDYYYSLCDLWGVNRPSTCNVRKKRSKYTHEQQIARMKTQLEKTNARLEKLRIAEKKAIERANKAQQHYESMLASVKDH